MTCDECQTHDHITLYRHPETNRRYCFRCWNKFKPNQPIPIDRCSDAVKNAAALAGGEGTVWRPKRTPERFIITQIIDGAAVTCCGVCKMTIGKCNCDASRAKITDELNHSISEAQSGLAIIPSPHRPELHKCALCETVSNDGAWMDVNLYWCGTCLADIEEGGGMKTKHIKLKLRGSDKAIAFFHFVCTQIDNDWPWNNKKPQPTVCPKCGGVLYIAAVLEAEEIRTIAQQAGVGKCKIPYFGNVENCFGR